MAEVRQQLLEPSRALVGYGEELRRDADAAGHDAMLADLERVLSAATSLATQVDHLMDGHRDASADQGESDRRLRHDLRTPINAIKGYAEMLIEDLDQFGATEMHDDLERLLGHADTLLDRIDRIVTFSREEHGAIVDTPGSNQLANRLVETISAAQASHETGRILVVDDIESNRDLLARRLRRDGHDVTLVPGGREALEKLDRQTFDMVLLDLMMPEMNGFEVLTRMKADRDLRNIPVVMVSALDEMQSVVRCIEAGADDYLTKPFNDHMLKARIKAGLENKVWSDEERQQRRFIREAFSKFVSAAVVDQLLDDPSRLTLGGERVDITCIFTDLADFTAMIERAAPALVIPVLNDYLDGMSRIVLEHLGTMDKIVGDAVHAFFGAPLRQPDHPERAIRCALALNDFAIQFANRPDARAVEFGHTRIGVHTGVAVVGNFGGEQFFDYTAHGDVINTTARMESANKYLGTTICVSGDTAARCPGIPFRPIGTLLLRGKSRRINAFEPLSMADANSERVNDYLAGFTLLESESTDAHETFKALRARYPLDPLIAIHAERLLNGERGILMMPGDA
ncbi:MAG: response regulator [Pseudomonadota bacterium]